MINIVKNIEEANFVTHGGKFHADEVFATVLLSKIFDDIKLIRLLEYKDDGSKITYDIGGGELDHHQEGKNGKRDNDVYYSSVGLVFKKYGKEIISKYTSNHIEEVVNKVDKDFITYIDALDNGIGYKTDAVFNIVNLDSIISWFNPFWNSNDDSDDCFMDAVNLANIVFDRYVKSVVAKQEAVSIVEEAINNSHDGYMVLDEFVPWKDILLNSSNPKANDILFCIHPSNRGGYSANAVPLKDSMFENKCSFPNDWAGKRDEELKNISGISTLRFCHNGLFIACTDNMEDAIEAVKIAIEKRP